MKLAFWVVFLLIIAFILVPVFMLFKESMVGQRLYSEEELKDGIEAILGSIPEEQQRLWAEEWWSSFSEEAKREAYAQAWRYAGLGEVGFDGLSLEAMEERLSRLAEGQRVRFEEALRTEIFYRKRAPFMFKAKPYVSDKEFERLRSGYESTLTGEHYRKVLTTPYLFGAITRSLRIAFVSMIFTVGVAYLFAYTINRTTCRFKPFFNAMMLLPLVSPPVIMAFALVMLFGRRGIITNGLLDNMLHLIDAEHFNIYGMHGIVLAQMLTYGPVAFVVLHSVLAQLDTRIEEASETLGASRWYTFRRVILPMSYPGLFRAALLVFALCLQDFGNPRIIGGEITMIAGVMYDQMIGFQNANIAAVLGIILLIPSIAAYIVGNILLARKTYASKEPGGMLYVSETPKLSRGLFEASCFLFSLLVVVLYLTIVLGSFVKVWGHDSTLTLGHWLGVRSPDASFMEAEPTRQIPLLLQSVKTMGVAGIIGGLFAVVAGYVLERRSGGFSDVVTYMILLTVALPGVVFGIGYILSFNAPFGVPELALTGTMWIIVLLIIFTRMYGGVLSTQAVLQKVDISVEEAAISLGAGRLYTFRKVVFPVLRRPWLLGSLYIFISGLVALGGVIFLTSAKHVLVSVQIYILAEQGKYGLACVHSTYLIAIVIITQLLIRMVEKRGAVAIHSG
jgi:iron(III) transport system permease protein